MLSTCPGVIEQNFHYEQYDQTLRLLKKFFTTDALVKKISNKVIILRLLIYSITIYT